MRDPNDRLTLSMFPPLRREVLSMSCTALKPCGSCHLCEGVS